MVPFRVDQEGLQQGPLHMQNLGGPPERANLRGPQTCVLHMKFVQLKSLELQSTYSGTSDKGPSEIGTTSLQGTKLLVP